MAQARDTAYFIAAIRQLSNTEDDPAVTDTEVRDRASEAKSSLYDLILASYEHYAVKAFDFSLVGGVGANTVDLPTDFYKDVSLTLNPTTTPITVHRMSSWVERNNLQRRGYTLLGSELVVNPPTMAQGDYRLNYTPLDLPFQAPTVITVAYTTIVIDTTGGAADGTLHNYFFPTGAFDASYILGMLHIAGSVSNNGDRLISSVPDATDLRTASSAVTSESFGGGVTAEVYLVPVGSVTLDQVTIGGSNTWVFHGLDTSDLEVGTLVTISGSVGCDGTYTVDGIVNAHTFTTAESPGVFETFLPGVTVTFQEAGTVNELPQIMVPWYEYIQVHGAIAVKDKIEQDTADLEVRLSRLTERIQSMAANRMEEGGQIAMPDRRNSFWDDDGWPWV